MAAQHENLARDAEDLYALLHSPFEGGFVQSRFSGVFELPVDTNAYVRRDPMLKALIEEATGAHMDPHKHWAMELGYDEAQQSIVLSELTIPLHSPSPMDNLLFCRFQQGVYAVLHERYRKPMPDVVSLGERKQVMLASEPEVNRILFNAHYQVPSSPMRDNDVHLAISNLCDRSPRWMRSERLEILEDPFDMSRTVITRHAAREPRRDSGCYRTLLQMTSEMVASRSAYRHQMNVAFASEVDNPYAIALPDITYRRFNAAAELGPLLDVCVEKPLQPDIEKPLPVTRELLATLSGIVVDALS